MSLIFNSDLILPGKTFFRVSKTAPQNFTHGNMTIIDYSQELSDPQNAYSNPYYTVSVSGLYFFGAAIFLVGGVNYKRSLLSIYRGASEVIRCSDQFFPSYFCSPSPSGSGIVEASGGDLISARLYVETTDSSSTATIDNTSGTINSMIFYGYKIN
jgi:hypothetical protein